MYKENYYIVLFGRLLFGIGLENYNICGYNIANRWFKSSHISLAMGLIITFGRVSMVTSSFVYPLEYDRTKLLWKALVIGFYMCLFSFVSVIILSIFDKKCSESDQ